MTLEEIHEAQQEHIECDKKPAPLTDVTSEAWRTRFNTTAQPAHMPICSSEGCAR